MNVYETQAAATKSRRRKAGAYATTAHLAAGRKLIGQGVTALSAAELETLSTHPFMSSGQKAEFARLAKLLQ